MYQSLFDYYLEAWTESPACPHLCYPKVHVSSRSTVRQATQGVHTAREHVSGLDSLMATVMEWAQYV